MKSVYSKASGLYKHETFTTNDSGGVFGRLFDGICFSLSLWWSLFY